MNSLYRKIDRLFIKYNTQEPEKTINKQDLLDELYELYTDSAVVCDKLYDIIHNEIKNPVGLDQNIKAQP